MLSEEHRGGEGHRELEATELKWLRKRLRIVWPLGMCFEGPPYIEKHEGHDVLVHWHDVHDELTCAR